jgi:hypothetical protein
MKGGTGEPSCEQSPDTGSVEETDRTKHAAEHISQHPKAAHAEQDRVGEFDFRIDLERATGNNGGAQCPESPNLGRGPCGCRKDHEDAAESIDEA